MGHVFSTPVPGGRGLSLSVLTLLHLEAMPVHALSTAIAPGQKSRGCTGPARGGTPVVCLELPSTTVLMSVQSRNVAQGTRVICQ